LIASSDETTGWMLYPVRNLMSSSAKMLEQLDHRGLDLELVEVDRGDAVLLRDELGELVLVQEAELRDLGAEPPALGARLFACLAQLLRAEEVLLDEKLPDPLVHRRAPSTPLCGTRSDPDACAVRCAGIR
jgi:hypothetical protein